MIIGRGYGGTQVITQGYGYGRLFHGGGQEIRPTRNYAAIRRRKLIEQNNMAIITTVVQLMLSRRD